MHHKIAVIGGQSVEDLLKEKSVPITLTANYRSNCKQSTKAFGCFDVSLGGPSVVFANRYSVGNIDGKSRYRPHEIDYKTIMVGLHQAGIDTVISISKVGSLQEEWTPGTLVLIRDYIDMVNRDTSLDDLGSDIADMTNPFDQPLLKTIESTAAESGIKMGTDAIYVLTIDGSRFETPSEIRLIRNMFSGRLVVGMTVPTEAQLAKMLNIRYAAISVVTNYAAGMRNEINNSNVEGVFTSAAPKLLKLVTKSVQKITSHAAI